MKDTRREEGVRQTGGTGRANAITEGVIWKQLLLFFFPILFGTFFQQLYNTADAVVVGRFVGKEALAAVGGSTSMLTNLLVGFFVGLSSGATVIIAQFYGAGRGQRVSEAVHTAIAFSLLCGILMTVGGLLFSDTALRLMGTPEDIMDNASGYLHIYFVGITANLLYNMGAGILRAIGDSKKTVLFPCDQLFYKHCARSVVCSRTSDGRAWRGGGDDSFPGGQCVSGIGNADACGWLVPV